MKQRYLTDDEINDLLDFIQPNKHIPHDSAMSIVKNNKDRLTKQLKKQKIYPELIPKLKKNLQMIYIKTSMDPGESVGIIAAMSIGEKQTQNSIVYGEEILVKKNNKISKTTIGKFIDSEMQLILPDDKNNYIKRVKDIQILTVSQDERIEWKYVTDLSRHPTNGDLVKVTTESGRSVTTTLAHSHLRKEGKYIVPVLGSDLTIGDRIPVIRQSPKESIDQESLFIPRYIDFNIISDIETIVLSNDFHTKRIDEIIYSSSNFIKIRLIKTFIQLRGYWSNSKEVLEDYIMLLTQFGILAHIVNMGLVIQKKYVKILSELISEQVPEEMSVENFEYITMPSCITNICPVVAYINVIILGMSHLDVKMYDNAINISKIIVNYEYTDIKQILGDHFEILKNILLKSGNEDISILLQGLEKCKDSHIIWDKIVSLKLIKCEEDYIQSFVYDFSVQGNKTFALFSGIIVHNTLNSVDWEEQILFMKNDECNVEPIGKMIDKLLLQYPENIEQIEENRTEYLILDNGYFIPSCDENGNTGWYKIEAITRHLPVGDLVKVTTESGRTVMATQSKSFLVWDEVICKFIATAGCDVKIGDILPTTEGLPRFNDVFQENYEYNDIKIKLDSETGYIIGLYLTNNITKLLLEKDIKKKYNNWFEIYNVSDDFFNLITDAFTKIPNFCYNTNDKFLKGLLSGYFINCEYGDNRSISVYNIFSDINSGILFLLTYFGIFGYNINNKIIINNTLEFFMENIYINNLVMFDKVKNIELCTGTTDYVYDLTIKETRNFQLFNGLNIRDTFL